MGGVKFFSLAVETPEGDAAVLDVVLEGMNAEVDEASEERKGGAGAIGKLLLSAGDKTLAMVCHVPKALQEEKKEQFNMKEWIDAVVAATGATIDSQTDELVKFHADGDAAAERFPLKLRDAGQAAAIAYIRSKGLIPDEDSDDYIPDPEAAGIEW
jgi:hypothetical protein